MDLFHSNPSAHVNSQIVVCLDSQPCYVSFAIFVSVV